MPYPAAAQQAVAAAIREHVERRPMNPADPVERAVVIALVDQRVHDALVTHLARNEVYIGAGHLPRYSAQEHVVVTFEFRRLPPQIAFVPPVVAVRVNVDSGEVEAVIDPYRGEPVAALGTPGSAFFPRGAPAKPG